MGSAGQHDRGGRSGGGRPWQGRARFRQVGQAFGLSPFALGATISLITLVSAVVAAPAGQWLRDRDPRPWLAAGLHHWLLIAYLAVPAAIVGAAAMAFATLARRQAGGASPS